MDESPFAKLPLEVRTQIYEEVLHLSGGLALKLSSTPIATSPYPQTTRKHKIVGSTFGGLRIEIASPNKFALTAVCKEMRVETIPILFSCTSFHFTTNVRKSGGSMGGVERVDKLHDFYHELPEQVRTQVRHFRVSLEVAQTKPGADLEDACKDLAGVAEMLSKTRITASCDLTFRRSLDRLENAVIEDIPLTSSGVLTYVKERFPGEARMLMQAWKDKITSNKELGAAQDRLQIRRKYVEPALRRLSGELQKVEAGEVSEGPSEEVDE